MIFEALILDVETTCKDNPELVQVAWINPADSTEEYCENFRPEGKISLGALATHHILPEELEGCRPSSEFRLPEVEYLIGHNVDFDWRAIGSPQGVKRICTLALARWLYPEADSHSLGAMMYHIFPGAVARGLCRDAHDALADVKMCGMLLHHQLEEMRGRGIPTDTWEEIHLASEAARIPKIMPFGKHKGAPIHLMPPDYKRWLLGQPNVDEYLAAALRGPTISGGER